MVSPAASTAFPLLFFCQLSCARFPPSCDLTHIALYLCSTLKSDVIFFLSTIIIYASMETFPLSISSQQTRISA
ncbi:hypothetical protein BDA96_02G260500 [Sorghum bicolor]|uniref:Secreted protein n=1 Tax=Sorghum bicolor TaxID=4558 RepID=A0A921RQU5_SORBI|nr:hypothetical protein BDA96_02G260500 [Sorghum bicolor]